MATRLTIRFDFDAERRLGPGKVALLKSIAQTGSISAAGRRHAMSYRRAWLLVEELNRTFGEALVTARPGGAGGGGAALTAAGERITALRQSSARCAPRQPTKSPGSRRRCRASRWTWRIRKPRRLQPPALILRRKPKRLAGMHRGKGKTRARLPSPRLRREAG